MAPPPANDGTRKVLGDIGNRLNGPHSLPEAAWEPLKPAHQQRQQPVDLTITESDDEMQVDDPQSVKEYVREIHTLLCRDNLLRPRPEYMDAQQEINAKMRAILIDWIVQVHMKYCLRTETLFLSVQLLDRFLSRKQVPRKQLQLIGATALLIASKYEDVYPPEISQLVYISDSACTRDEIVLCELVMLKELGFRICRPTPADFLKQYNKVNRCSIPHEHLVGYLLELTLLELRMICHPPAVLAAAAIFLSNKMMRAEPAWPQTLSEFTGLKESMIMPPAREMCALFEGAEGNSQQAVRKKYSHQKYSQVARLRF